MGLFPSDISDHIDVVQHFMTGDGWLSEYFNQRNDERITLINADIEGFEMDMLEGMEHIIKRDKPKIAVAAYHRPSDLWKIQGKLASLREDYKFDMVHHGVSASETVLYAY